jgi:UDP-glucose 4-epimerase
MSLVWVTGAAGFIGRHLVSYLAGRGHSVAGIDLFPVDSAELDACVAAWDASGLSPEGLSALRERTGMPEIVYHLAGGSSVGASLGDPAGDFATTVSGTAILLEWLRSSSAETRLVVVSSAAVYGNIHSGGIGEDAATDPYSPYGAHKFAMEATVKGWSTSFGIPAAVVRLFSVYGPGLRKQLLWDLSNRLHHEAGPVVLGGSGAELRDWTHVDDVVRAIEAASGLAQGGMPIVNAGSTIPTNVRQIAHGLAKAFGADPARIEFSGEARAGDPYSLFAAPGGRLASLGFQWRTDINAGLQSYADWYRSAVLR